MRCLDPTQFRHTHSKTTLNELSACCRGRYLHNKHKRRTSVSSSGFEPAVPTIDRPLTYALDRKATAIGNVTVGAVIFILAVILIL